MCLKLLIIFRHVPAPKAHTAQGTQPVPDPPDPLLQHHPAYLCSILPALTAPPCLPARRSCQPRLPTRPPCHPTRPAKHDAACVLCGLSVGLPSVNRLGHFWGACCSRFFRETGGGSSLSVSHYFVVNSHRKLLAIEK